MLWLEVLGWAGSAVLIASLAQASVLRFRVLNLVASLALTGYNLVLAIWPMVALNLVSTGINVYFLLRLLRTRDDAATYEVVEVGAGEGYLRHVLGHLAPDLQSHNPGFDWDAGAGSLAFLVVRGTETVGVVLLRERGDGQADVLLDYVVPRFRDFSVGRFVYRPGGPLTGRGLHRLLASTRMPDADTYFPRVGFRPGPDRGPLVLDLA